MPYENKWKALPCELKDWGDNVLVYHHPSGNTHLLNSTAALALELLQKNSGTTQDIAKQISSTLEITLGNEIISQIQVIIDNLNELGLIEPVEITAS